MKNFPDVIFYFYIASKPLFIVRFSYFNIILNLILFIALCVGFKIQNWSVNYWLDKGASPDKLVVAVPAYGRSFTLINTQNTSIGAPANTSGLAGPFTREPGVLAYYEVSRTLPARVGRLPWARWGTQEKASCFHS